MRRLAILLALVLISPVALAKIGEDAIRVEADATEKLAKPQSVALFTLTIANQREETTKVWFEIASKLGRGQFITPVPIVLQPAGSPEARANVPVGVQTPYENGRLNETSRVTYRITPRDPFSNATLDDPQDVTFTVRTVGTYVPAPQFFGVFVALALAALLLRRRAAS